MSVRRGLVSCEVKTPSTKNVHTCYSQRCFLYVQPLYRNAAWQSKTYMFLCYQYVPARLRRGSDQQSRYWYCRVQCYFLCMRLTDSWFCTQHIVNRRNCRTAFCVKLYSCRFVLVCISSQKFFFASKMPSRHSVGRNNGRATFRKNRRALEKPIAHFAMG